MVKFSLEWPPIARRQADYREQHGALFLQSPQHPPEKEMSHFT